MKSSSNAVTPSANNPGSTLHTGSIGGSFVPLTTPTSMLLPKPTSQGKVGACSNPASLGCSHTLPQNNTADLVVTAAAAAASSRSPASVDTGSNGRGDSVGAQSLGVAHPLASGPASRITGLGSSDTGNGGSGATQAMISIGVVAGIGVLAVGVIVLRRMRGRWRGGSDDHEYDGHASDGGRKTKKMTRKSDQHIGLGSFNSTKGGVTESRQPEQFWNP
ncbi:hypothetical protein BGZ99_000247 [Dissophora globulifera]|uniref:Uncharacterized protein n=1 Tax=Dissophora globulifera TaxID=979702 RepID=A0A9P6UYB1_9FUNG|nr:hypothetical protein BGZ99_000247 [Dissophora globulifera]